jgi:hypothetical protein
MSLSWIAVETGSPPWTIFRNWLIRAPSEIDGIRTAVRKLDQITETVGVPFGH